MTPGQDTPRDIDESDLEVDSFEQWIEQVASSRDISKREVFDHMMSSYWIFTELAEFMEGAGSISGIKRSNDITDAQERAGETNPSNDKPQKSADDDTVLEELRTLMELLQLVDQFSEGRERPPKEEMNTASQDPDLQRELERLESKLGETDAQLDEAIQEIRSQMELLLDRLEALESQAEEERVGERFEAVREELTALDSRQTAIENQLDKSFEHLEVILEHMITQIDGIESRVDPVDDLLRDHQVRAAERDLLERLKRTADRRGITTATCDQCRESINLSLLERPVCHNCSAPFDKLTERRRFAGLLNSAILETQLGETQTDQEITHSPGEFREHEATDPGEERSSRGPPSRTDRDNSRPSVGFEWGTSGDSAGTEEDS